MGRGRRRRRNELWWRCAVVATTFVERSACLLDVTITIQEVLILLARVLLFSLLGLSRLLFVTPFHNNPAEVGEVTRLIDVFHDAQV